MHQRKDRECPTERQGPDLLRARRDNIKHQTSVVRTSSESDVPTRPDRRACDVGESVEAYKKYKCYPCKPGKTCDMGPGDEERCKWSSGTFVGIFLVFLGPIIFCIFAGVGWYVHKRKNADETYAAAARRVLCRRGTKVRAVARTRPRKRPAPASVVSVVDAPAAGIAPRARHGRLGRTTPGAKDNVAAAAGASTTCVYAPSPCSLQGRV